MNCILYTIWVILMLLGASSSTSDDETLNILTKYNENNVPGRIFEGIGGISGGGATSKLLVNYKEPYRSQVLDYLFKPNFGASVHILKVEIGGDAESTEGTEASHMHVPWEENYERGYEWWIMKEAKKRNPDILLYGLPWAFPGWIGSGQRNPYVSNIRTATYIVKWILGAKRVHNLTLDYVGIWNENAYNIDYVKTLRKLLDSKDLSHVQIVVGDNTWSPAEDVVKDPAFNKSFYAIGAHYPGTLSTPLAQSVGKPLWSSEDYSTFNDDVGAGCWARILNQNYVNGLMTSTISWNLVASYYDEITATRQALMTANEPWSGYYDLTGPVWITAHTTQFTKPGWRYLPHGQGVGKLPKGGSYVSLLSPDGKDLTIIIETMSHDHSICVRPPLPAYNVSAQNVAFRLGTVLKSIDKLHRWESRLRFDKGQNSTYFVQTDDIKIVNETFMLNLPVDTVITLSTLNTARRGRYPDPPPSQSFPVPYFDNFEDYPESSEPYMLTPQVGSLEVVLLPSFLSVSGTPNKVAKQTVMMKPVQWCLQTNLRPISIIGSFYWKTVHASCSMMIPSVNGTNGIFMATRVDKASCYTWGAKGIFVWLLSSSNRLLITGDIQQKNIFMNTSFAVPKDVMHILSLNDKGSSVDVYVNGTLITTLSNIPTSLPKNGFLAVGLDNFGIAYFDSLRIDSVSGGKINKPGSFKNYNTNGL